MTKADTNNLIKQIVQDNERLREISQTENYLSDAYDPKESQKIGKRFDRNMEILLKTEEGIAELYKLLEGENSHIRFMAARYLFPIYPKKCLDILIDYRTALTDDRERMEVNNVIDGLIQNRKVFIEQYKRLYGCDDLSPLSREDI